MASSYRSSSTEPGIRVQSVPSDREDTLSLPGIVTRYQST